MSFFKNVSGYIIIYFGTTEYILGLILCIRNNILFNCKLYFYVANFLSVLNIVISLNNN